jgi:hypothetical protein
MKMIIEIDDDTYNSLDLYVRNDSKGKGVIHNCLHAIKNGIPVNENDSKEKCPDTVEALNDLKQELDEIITMKDTFIYHLVMDAIERKIREVEKVMRTE